MAARSVNGPATTWSAPLIVWAARASLYFAVQGALVLLAYAYYGLDSDPQSFPLGFRLDPIHAGVHFVWGLAGTYVGFFNPRFATAFVLAFAVFYTALAVLGSFTDVHFGMQLGHTAAFHWLLVGPVWALLLRELWIARRGT